MSNSRKQAKALLLAVFLLAPLLGLSACGSANKSKAAAVCTVKSARAANQDFITNSKFDFGCVKVPAGTNFFFVNNDVTGHTVTAQPGAPEAIDAELPNKGSTYSHVFTAKGEYHVNCRFHNEKMTLFVT